jgi:hypothetical protein
MADLQTTDGAGKVCTRCHQYLPLSEFHFQPKSPSTTGRARYRAACRKCDNERCRQYRKTDSYREMNIDRVCQYWQTPKGRAYQALREAMCRKGGVCYKQRKIQERTRYLIRIGRLLRQTCRVCGAERSEAHHPDYSEPTNVDWLCSLHHKEEHRLRPVSLPV